MVAEPKANSRQQIDALEATFLSRKPTSAKSLISTLFGDSVVPYGGKIWLENIIQLVEPLGINERLVRTSVYRLIDDEWISNTRLGRRSYYQLSTKGQKQTALADQLIYHPPTSAWDGQWTLLFSILPTIEQQQRLALRDQLSWLGFGRLSKDVYGHPNIELPLVQSLIHDLGLAQEVICMKARTPSNETWSMVRSDAELARQCCPYEDVAASYEEFVQIYSVLANSLTTENLSDESRFSLKTLLIHDYRRIVLKDPQLPAELLPESWVGETAKSLCEQIYRQVTEGANRHYLAVCGDDNKIKPLLSSSYQRRFGGI